MTKKKKDKLKKWAIAAIALVLIGLLSAWTILTQQANQDKSYSGAKFVGCQVGGLTDG